MFFELYGQIPEILSEAKNLGSKMRMCVSNFAASIGLCNFTVKRFMLEKVVFQELDKLAWHI